METYGKPALVMNLAGFVQVWNPERVGLGKSQGILRAAGMSYVVVVGVVDRKKELLPLWVKKCCSGSHRKIFWFHKPPSKLSLDFGQPPN